jgi:hypothetical protein
MEGYETPGADARQTLRSVKYPTTLQAAEGLFVLRKNTCGLALGSDAPAIEGDGPRLGKASTGAKSRYQSNGE